MKRGLSSGRKTTLVFRGTYGTAAHGGGSGSYSRVFHHGCGCLWCLVGRHRSLTAAVALDRAGSGPRVGSRGLNCGLSGVSSLSRRRLRRRLPRLLVRDCSGGLSGYLGSSPCSRDAARARPSPLPPRSEEGRGREVQRAACSVAAARRPSSD